MSQLFEKSMQTLELHRVLELLRDELYRQGALAVQVSGSGSSLFALFDGGSETAAMELKRDFPAELKIFTGSRAF